MKAAWSSRNHQGARPTAFWTSIRTLIKCAVWGNFARFWGPCDCRELSAMVSVPCRKHAAHRAKQPQEGGQRGAGVYAPLCRAQCSETQPLHLGTHGLHSRKGSALGGWDEGKSLSVRSFLDVMFVTGCHLAGSRSIHTHRLQTCWGSVHYST